MTQIPIKTRLTPNDSLSTRLDTAVLLVRTLNSDRNNLESKYRALEEKYTKNVQVLASAEKCLLDHQLDVPCSICSRWNSFNQVKDCERCGRDYCKECRDKLIGICDDDKCGAYFLCKDCLSKYVEKYGRCGKNTYIE